MSETYTPGTDDLRTTWAARTYAYGLTTESGEAEFDRWLAAHDESVRAEARAEALGDQTFVGVGFDGGTTLALTGENAGHWVEGSPTHVPIAELKNAEAEATRAAVLDWASRFIPGDRWDTEDLSDLEAALGGIVETHPTAHWRREQASLLAERDELAAVVAELRWLNQASSASDWPGWNALNGVWNIISAAPADVLAEHDKRVRFEALRDRELDEESRAERIRAEFPAPHDTEAK